LVAVVPPLATAVEGGGLFGPHPVERFFATLTRRRLKRGVFRCFSSFS